MGDVLYNLYEAKTSLSKLVDRAAAGEGVIIAKAGRPVVRMIPFEAATEPRRPGGWEGRVWIAEDFDAPLPDDLLAAFEGREGDA